MKTKFATEFINRIRNMDHRELTKLINREAGEELAQFFIAYSGRVLKGDPNAASSLMLMGYLLRAAEEEKPKAATVFNQKVGLA